MIKKFFFYGTLRDRDRKDAKATKDCKVKGFALYRWEFGWYPLATPHKRGVVHGTLHDFAGMRNADFSNMVKSIDQYEGCNTHNPKWALYFRRIVEVTLPNGKTTKAYMYEFNREQPMETQPRFRIPEGNWDNRDKIKVWTKEVEIDGK